MKIIDVEVEQDFITLAQAKQKVENRINNSTKDHLYILKYDGNIISISGDYYKFAWKTIGNLRAALSNKFGKELAESLVENDVIEVIKLYI